MGDVEEQGGLTKASNFLGLECFDREANSIFFARLWLVSHLPDVSGKQQTVKIDQGLGEKLAGDVVVVVF
jgi:hypothetical protein